MRNYSLLLCICLLLAGSSVKAHGQTEYYERIYAVTDKSSYVAGENLWLSLFCLDAQTGHLSSLSSVAYIELCDEQKSLIQVKAALQQGRGSAIISLPSGLPTGNYLLRAYTRYMQNEGEEVFFSMFISIYNVLSTEKTAQTFVVEDGELMPVQRPTILEVPLLKLRLSASELSTRTAFSIEIENPGDELAYYALSVYALDSLEAAANPSLVSYSRNLPAKAPLSNEYIADYEGEILTGRVVETGGAASLPLDPSMKAYLSVVGSPVRLVEGKIDAEGRVLFYTPGIYGGGNMATELYPQPSQSAQIVLDNAFANYTPKPQPSLRLYPDTEEALLKRGLSMQLGHVFFLDTLHAPQTPLMHQLLFGNSVSYVLDHYTRFPRMREVIAEFVAEARIRSLGGENVFMVRLYNGFNEAYYADEKALVLLDGVPVFNHESILNFDALLIERISIYDGIYRTGSTTHYGVIDIKTYKGNLSGMNFPEAVRITSFDGLQYPLRFKGPEYDASRRALNSRFKNLPDWRHSLYWDADLQLKAGEKQEIVCHTSDYTGNFVVVIEGLTASGKAFHQTARFNVK
jgi:hypothetical protein